MNPTEASRSAEDPARERWRRETYEPARARRSERRESFATPSGLEPEPIYGAAHDGGWPGEYPFTRGIRETMYRGRLWTMRQYAGFGTPAETRRRFEYLIERGQTGLNVAFDLPTQCGLDSDDLMAEGEVGRVGMAVDTLADMVMDVTTSDSNSRHKALSFVYQVLGAINYFAVSEPTLARMLGRQDFSKLRAGYEAELRTLISARIDLLR